MFRVELGEGLPRWRTWLLAAALGGVPVLIVFAREGVAARPAAPPRTPRRSCSRSCANGLFAPLTGLAVVQPFFLPLAMGLFAGDAIAGEAQSGTLRYLLLRPVRRARLVLAKYCSSMTLLGALVARQIVAGVVAGGVVFGFGPLPTLSGSTLSVTEGARARRRASGVYMLAALSGIACVGLCISTLTDSGPGATVATVIVAIASQIIDQIPSLHAIHPFLPTHGWLGFTGLFRFPVDWAAMRAGLDGERRLHRGVPGAWRSWGSAAATSRASPRWTQPTALMMSSDSWGNCCRWATRSVFSRSTMCVVLVAAALTLVEPARLEQLGVVESRAPTSATW